MLSDFIYNQQLKFKPLASESLLCTFQWAVQLKKSISDLPSLFIYFLFLYLLKIEKN